MSFREMSNWEFIISNRIWGADTTRPPILDFIFGKQNKKLNVVYFAVSAVRTVVP